MADVQLVADCVAAGILIPPDAARRVHERAAQLRREILEKQGVRDVGVMKCVLDSSVSFKWVVPESDSDKADRLRDAFRNAIHELLAPDVFSLER